jgi:hypothetical protein
MLARYEPCSIDRLGTHRRPGSPVVTLTCGTHVRML